MPTSPADLLALAARCCAGETTDELRDAVLIALGRPAYEPAIEEDGSASDFVRIEFDPLSSLDASAAAMPAGWLVDVVIDADWTLVTTRRTSIGGIEQAEAPTEPLARTAAALMARAAELEQKESTP